MCSSLHGTASIFNLISHGRKMKAKCTRKLVVFALATICTLSLSADLRGMRNRMQSCLQKCNKLNKSRLVRQLLNSIHDARTHVYKIQLIFSFIGFGYKFRAMKVPNFNISLRYTCHLSCIRA